MVPHQPTWYDARKHYVESLANIEFYGPILAILAATIVVLGLHIRALHKDAQDDAKAHAQQLKQLGEAHAAEQRVHSEDYAKRLELITALHAAKLDEIGAHRADQAREMVETLLSIQESRAEEQRAMNSALSALEATMAAVKEAVTSLSDRTLEHIINSPRTRRPST